MSHQHPASQALAEALEYRLQDSEARVAICDMASLQAIDQVRDDCPLLETVIGVGEAGRGADLDGTGPGSDELERVEIRAMRNVAVGPCGVRALR